MAYNKSKNVEAAQKLLNQGKVAQAIAEYQQILKYEPRDQVTLMTIGELYIRQGETFQAIDYFERLAQLFVSDGFLTKAIAVYKRIAKLAPEEIRPLEKLADLYVQQGVMSEARPLFLQLAELHLKNNKQPEAIALLKKLLLAEPDNLRIQVRLADLYAAMGQSGEALEMYIAAAQRALARADQAECERLADKALQINPKNLPALIVKARSFSSVGNIAQAAKILEQVPDLEKGGEPAELLLDLYLKNAKWDEATTMALKIFASDEKNFGATQKVTEALLEQGQGERAMSLLSRIRIPMIDGGEHEGVAHLLNELAGRLPGRLEPLEWLVDTYGRMSDSFRLPDALANLGDGLVAAGKVDRAKEVFEQLLEREPESDSAKRKLNDVLRKLGLLEPEAAPMLVPDQLGIPETLQAELQKPEAPKVRPGLQEVAPEVAAQKATAAPTEPQLDEETQKFIAQSLTDVDLFASYGLTQKAIGLLEAILRRAPTHTPTLEKLLDFVLGAGDDRRTAELAGQLEHIHAQSGDTRSSERFGELRRRFQRAAGLTDEEIAAAVAAAMPQAVEAVPVEEIADLETAELGAELTVQSSLDQIPEVSVAPAPGETPESPVAGLEAAAVVAESGPEAVLDLPEIEIIEEAPVTPAKPQAGRTEEVDLSSEWSSLLEETKELGAHVEQPVPEPAAPVAPEPTVEEIELSDFLVEPEIGNAARKVPEAAHPAEPNREHGDSLEFEVPVEATPTEEQASALAEISSELPLASLEAAAISEAAPAAEEVVEEHASDSLLPEEELTALPVPERSELAAGGPEPELELPMAALPEAAGPEPEFELDQDFELILEPEPVVPAHEMLSEIPLAPPAPDRQQTREVHAREREEEQGAARVNGTSFTSEQFLADLANEIDELGLGEIAESKSKTLHSDSVRELGKAPGSVYPDLESGPLKEVFEEFRAELGEMGAEDEDLETHYNLGIAFREMGLLEEAIGEFQKVAKANDHGKAFRYAMQCCTLLGLAFMEKGQPAIAAIWYERALLTPGIDSESKLALRYDLGVAQESAGDLEAALKSFSQVYAVNIDYRDVADRIAAHQKPAV
ncbi:MAG TPA: tetratricopeptide repeat protein [Candidatus Acidoferrum sp.]|nr:tetratricopeptide repeat protein [Candidatus Acidoferrum sp.]